MKTEVVVEFIAQGGTIIVALIAAVQAKRAKELSTPTGNGFASMVKDALMRIEGKIDRHVEKHAEEGMHR